MRLVLLGLIACVIYAATACSSAPAPLTAPIDVPNDTFQLEPGDVVRTQIYHEKEMSDTFRVDERGRLTLPLLGSINVIGRPWATLHDSLIAAYDKELRNPSIILTPMRRVQVLGEVTKPGQYLADPTLSLAGLVALAGGATPSGDLHRVRVVRNGRIIVQSASIESLLLRASVHSGDQVFVDRRSWMERNGAIVSSTLLSAAGILITILHR